MNHVLRILVAVLLFTGVSTFAAKGSFAENWEQFLNSADSNAYLNLKAELKTCRTEQPCAGRVVPNSLQVHELIKLVETSKRRAVEVAFLVAPFLDGGDLEDVQRALGGLIKQSPEQFLAGLESSNLSRHQKVKIVGMLPLESVDNFPMKKTIVDSRIRALSKVKKHSLIKARNKAISDLRELRVELDGQEAQTK